MLRLPAPNLYKKFFIDKQDERVDLFRKLAEQYKIRSANDLKQLRGFLSVIPAKFQVDGAPYWMGRDLVDWLVTDQVAACMKGKSINVRYTIDV